MPLPSNQKDLGQMSLLVDYSSSSESEGEEEQAPVVAPVKAPAPAPARKIIVAAKPASTETDKQAAAPAALAPDQSVSVFGKPSIASFLPAPKHRKKVVATPASNGSVTSTGAGLRIEHALSSKTRTLGGGIKNTFFDGEVSMAEGGAVEGSAAAGAAPVQPPAKRVKLVPAAVLAREAKAAKLARLGKSASPSPSPSSIPASAASSAPLPEPQTVAAPAQAKPKSQLPSLFTMSASQGNAMVGPAAAPESERPYEPIMLERAEPESEDDEDQPQAPIQAPDQDTSTPSPSIDLSAHERGRHAAPGSSVPVVDFSVSDFYASNLALKAQGALAENKRPVQAVGGGRHQLSSLLRSAQTNQEGLAQMHAEHRKNKREAGSKYGF